MPVILDILEEHLEEIEFLWAQREDALRSSDYLAHEVIELEDRIDAHLEGLLVGGEECIPIATELLVDEDRFIAFAGAWCLARQGFFDPIFGSLAECNIVGVAEALCHCEIGSVTDRIAAQYADGPPTVASAMGLVLAFHGKLPNQDRLPEWVAHEDPVVRQLAWKTVALAQNK